jgi:hypothetical protein
MSALSPHIRMLRAVSEALDNRIDSRMQEDPDDAIVQTILCLASALDDAAEELEAEDAKLRAGAAVPREVGEGWRAMISHVLEGYAK